MPPRARFLLFSRNDPKVTEILDGVRHNLDTDPTATDDIAFYAERRLGALESATRRLVIGKFREVARENFLFAKLALDEILSGGGSREELLARIDPVLGEAKTPDALATRYRSFIQQSFGYNMERWSERYRPLLAALAVSRGSGLTRTQLRGILGRQPSEISDALKSVGEYLNTQSAEGPFRLFHSSFGKFLLTDGVYGMERAETNERIANYFITEYTGRWSSCQDQYAISYTATHLVDAAQSAEGRNDRARLLGKLAALVRAEDFLEAHLSHAPDGTLAEQISNAMDLSADQTEKATFAKLLEFLRAENTPKTSDQPESLTERIRLHLTAASASTTGLPPGNGSAEGAATVPQSVSPPANQPVSNEAEEEAELRRALPMSVRIELDVWRRAQTAGKVFLAVSVLVCTAAMVLALGPVPSVFLWIGKALYYVIVLAAIYSSLTVFLENRKAKSLVIGTSTASIAALPTPSDSPPEPDRPWEILPEVVALRAGGKRFQLFGAINVASPYFEIGTVLYIAIAVVASISPLSPFSR